VSAFENKDYLTSKVTAVTGVLSAPQFSYGLRSRIEFSGRRKSVVNILRSVLLVVGQAYSSGAWPAFIVFLYLLLNSIPLIF